jgi:dihydropteroate synthase
MIYYRPLAQQGHRPPDALGLAGGWSWFTHVERLERGQVPQVVPVAQVPADWLAALTAPRAPVASVAMDAPRLMGILNVTPDSFSDGGRFVEAEAAVAQARAMHAAGAAILDIGGESTRPGAEVVDVATETRRSAPVIAALHQTLPGLPISIDSRKAAVASAALAAGAAMVNDVSALAYDPDMAAMVAKAGVPLCLMHAQGTPDTMQDDPRYADALLDVYDALAARIVLAEAAGIARNRILVDPGIGFGKTAAHNLALIRGIALFHGLGCPVLLGASRKGFIGTLAGVADPAARMPGSVAVALAAVAQGVQILRVHDVAATRQALDLWQALNLVQAQTEPEGRNR